nr:uncharacterized protein LOC106029524 [Anser cygnoides]
MYLQKLFLPLTSLVGVSSRNPEFHHLVNPEFRHLMLPAAKSAFNLHIPRKSFFATTWSSRSSLFIVSSGREAVVSALQDSPGLLPPSCAAPPAGIGVVEVSLRIRTRKREAMSVEGLIRLFFLAGRLLAGAHCNVTRTGLLFTPCTSLDQQPSPGRAPCTSAALSHEGQPHLLVLLTRPSPRACIPPSQCSSRASCPTTRS